MSHAWFLELGADAMGQMENVSRVSLAISLGQSEQMSLIVRNNKEIMPLILGRWQAGSDPHRYALPTGPEPDYSQPALHLAKKICYRLQLFGGGILMVVINNK